jgi:hypothetical protein
MEVDGLYLNLYVCERIDSKHPGDSLVDSFTWSHPLVRDHVIFNKGNIHSNLYWSKEKINQSRMG